MVARQHVEQIRSALLLIDTHVSTGLFRVVREHVLCQIGMPRKPVLATQSRHRIDTHVRPRNKIVGRVRHGLDDRVANDLVRKVNVRSVLDERETRLATARVPPEQDVLLQLGDVVGTPICGLLHDGLEVRIKRRHEALLAARSRGLAHALPEPSDRKTKRNVT